MTESKDLKQAIESLDQAYEIISGLLNFINDGPVCASEVLDEDFYAEISEFMDLGDEDEYEDDDEYEDEDASYDSWCY